MQHARAFVDDNKLQIQQIMDLYYGDPEKQKMGLTISMTAIFTIMANTPNHTHKSVRAFAQWSEEYYDGCDKPKQFLFTDSILQFCDEVWRELEICGVTACG